MGAEEDQQQSNPLLTNLLPLQLPPPSSDDHSKRTGNEWTATAHIITGVIGSGVLSLAWSTAQLGWIAGPLSMLIFAGITILSSSLLCDCYRSPHPETGLIRHRSYMEAVKFNLGRRSIWVCGVFQQISLYGTSLAYTITSAISMRLRRCYDYVPPHLIPKEGVIVRES